VSALSHPEIVPDYWTWEALFNDLAAPNSGILQSAGVDATSVDAVTRQANDAVSRAAAVRTAPKAAFDVDRETVAAESILAARDSLIRAGKPELFDSLNELAHARSQSRVYPLPAPGKTVLIGGTPKCVVNIKARDYPHLVPEFSYWEFYLRGYAVASAGFLVGTDDDSPDYSPPFKTGGCLFQPAI
jgi:hypothetical protein